MKKPVVLIIMDGFGLNPADYGNAIRKANTPNLDKIMKECPFTEIGASGMDVGLPDGQMGNSEVGHTNIGAGRVVYQELTRISKAISDGDFFTNPVFTKVMEKCARTGSALHLMGLVSDGGVHSHNTHLYALLDLAEKRGVSKIRVHCMLDGRDVPPTSGAEFVCECAEICNKHGAAVATVMGRYYGMDRDTQWDRVEKAYAAMVYGEGIKSADPVAAIRESYNAVDPQGKKITDEFVIPTVCAENSNIKNGDSVIFFNFRPDRAREITRAFCDPDFDGFPRRGGLLDIDFVSMTEYDATMPNAAVAFGPKDLTMTLGETLSLAGRTQLRIAETTKYAHVTFFLNGGQEISFPGEDRILIPTPEVATFDLKPEMSVYGIRDRVTEQILSGEYDAVIINFANCDMVGHTGIMDAAVLAVETVDECLGDVLDAAAKMGGTALVTADHGNADKMLEPDGSPFTAHTTFPVPFILVGRGDVKLRAGGRLCDIAPTMLELLGIAKPAEMDGESLIQ